MIGIKCWGSKPVLKITHHTTCISQNICPLTAGFVTIFVKTTRVAHIMAGVKKGSISEFFCAVIVTGIMILATLVGGARDDMLVRTGPAIDLNYDIFLWSAPSWLAIDAACSTAQGT
jgi:hypothetical protein